MPDSALERLEAALAEMTEAQYELTLFVNGASASSARAVRNAKLICETYLTDRYDLTVVDVNQDPELARHSRILATPTLLKQQPAPRRMVVGDLSDLGRVLVALDVSTADQLAARIRIGG